MGIVAIIIGSIILDIRPTDLEIGELKVKLETEIKSDIIISNLDMEETIKKEIKNELKNMGLDRGFPASDTNLMQGEDTDVVSNEVAEMAKIKSEKGLKTVFRSVIGYIWIGNFNPKSNSFANIKINTDRLDNLKIGDEYIVGGNMVIRKNSPVKNINYYRGEEKVGLAVQGTAVKILDMPEVKKLPAYHQYWVKIEVLQ